MTRASPVRMLALSIPGPVGTLEALLRTPPVATGAAVFAHPHPLFGGTMHTKVVHQAARLLSDRFGLTTLRFNFRGVGASSGVHDEGRGETDDLLAAARFVRGRHPSGPLVAGGFSFGSLCALRAARTLKPDFLLLAGVPLDRWSETDARALRGSRVAWVQGERDEFGAADRAAEEAGRLGFRFRAVAGADHFFTGRLEAFEAAAAALLVEAGLPAPGSNGDAGTDGEDGA